MKERLIHISDIYLLKTWSITADIATTFAATTNVLKDFWKVVSQNIIIEIVSYNLHSRDYLKKISIKIKTWRLTKAKTEMKSDTEQKD